MFSATYNSFGKVKAIINSFVSVSKFDPHLHKISGGKYASHNDGWGYVVIGEWSKGGAFILHYRSLKPSFEDLDGLYKLENTVERMSWIVGILHARKASKGLNKGLVDVHPFHSLTPSGIDIWVAHNGSIDIRKMGEKFPEISGSRSDTLLLTLYLASKAASGIEKALNRLIYDGYVKTALSLGILIASPENPPILYAFNYNIYEGINNSFANYYRLYEIKDKGLRAIVSSTIAENINMKAKAMKQGELTAIKTVNESKGIKIIEEKAEL